MRRCVTCGTPHAGERLTTDGYGAAVDDQGQFCSPACKDNFMRPGVQVHGDRCQCVTCVRDRDQRRARASAA